MKHALALVLALVPFGCGDDEDSGTAAERQGVGTACAGDDECADPNQTCLAFKGGYCGVQGCSADADCPQGSACVTHEDGVNYCFLLCTDKEAHCNRYRPADAEANCSSNIDFVDGKQGSKACVPPS